jgi:hypothetical protein
MTRAVPRTPRGVRWHKQSGAALLVILLIVLTFGIGALLQRANQSDGALWGRREASTDALQRAKEALIGYAITYRDSNPDETIGYFPCPDTDGDGRSDVPCHAASRAAVGLLPYRTLGLPDLRDAEGNCLWYAVSGAYKDNPKGTATPGTPPTGWAPLQLNWDTQGQFRVLDAEDNVLAAPDDANGGASVVIFAPNGPLAGQARTPPAVPGQAKICGVEPTQITAYLDEAYRKDATVLAEAVAPNFNFASGQTPANLPITVRQGIRRDVAGNVINNDLLAWITPREIFDRFVARADVPDTTAPAKNGLINQTLLDVAAILESKIHTDIDNGVGATASRPNDMAGAYNSSTSHWVGLVPSAYETDTLMDLAYRNILTNWSDNIRLATCKSLTGIGPGCLTMGGTTCRAGVFFAGRRPDGQPRTLAQHITSTATLSAGFESSAAVSPGALEILSTTSTVYPGAGKPRYADDPLQGNPARMSLRAADAGMCVMPADVSFISLRAAPAAFVPGVATTSTAAANPEARVDVASKTIVLGNTSGSNAGAGCVWFPQAIPFKGSLRAYFRIQVVDDDNGEGMTFAIADAQTNLAPNAPGRAQIMCGGPGGLLGYGGRPVGAPAMGIAPPKLAIEIDTRSSGGSINDPSADHLSVMYWGGNADNATGGTGDDDTNHGAGTNGVGEPRNPSTDDAEVINAVWSAGVVTIDTDQNHGFLTGDSVAISGVRLAGAAAPENTYDAGYNGTYRVTVTGARRFTYPLASNPGVRLTDGQVAFAGMRTISGPYFTTTGTLPLNSGGSVPEPSLNEIAGVVHIRVEVSKKRHPTLPQSLISIQAFAGDIAGNCNVEGYMNLARDLADICPLHRPQLIQLDVPIADNAGGIPAFDNIYLGFTNGQDSSRRQQIVISNFRARIQ